MITAPKITHADASSSTRSVKSTGFQQGLTIRSLSVMIFGLLLMGMWVQYEEVHNMTGGPIAENAPPNSAMGVILFILLISGLLFLLRRSLRLVPAELVVIYAALLVGAPLMSQGMWYRLFGLLSTIPHNQDFKSYESLPPMLWPHGENLIGNGRFVDKLDGFTHTGGGSVAWQPIAWKGNSYTCPVLSNDGDTKAQASLRVTLPRMAGSVEQLVPGEQYFFSCLVKAEQLKPDSLYFVKMQVDNGRLNSLVMRAQETPKTFALPSGFFRIGASPITLPRQLHDSLHLYIGLSGPGKLAIHDVQFFNAMAVEGGFLGRNIVRRQNLEKLDRSERDFTLVKPDNMWSLAGLYYLLQGYIPIKQWALPVLAWLALVGALFLGFFGLNVLMRRQWVEHERFTFPLNIVPRYLFGGKVGDDDHPGGLLRNRLMWLGFGLTFIIVTLKGLHFYYPALPPFLWSDVWAQLAVKDNFTNPMLTTFFQSVRFSVVFSLLAIALLAQTDILFSIWSSYLLFQFLPFFGKVLNFQKYAGYPWAFQQAIGAFIAYAVLALVAARRHLAAVFAHVMGRQQLDDSGEVVSYRGALWCLAISLLLFAAWGIWTKMGALASLLFFGYMLIIGFAGSKIRAECGLPFGYWAPYFNMMFLSAVGGFVVFGATGMLVATMASGFMSVSCFFFISPVQVEMMELGRFFRVRPRDIGHGLLLGLLGGVLIGGFVFLCWTYGFGADNRATQFAYKQDFYYRGYRALEAAADSRVTSNTQIAPANAPLNFVHNVDAKGIGIGFVVTCVLSFLRGLFPWFPLHPLGYVLATSFFATYVWSTCFVAWIIRVLVFRIAGTRAVRNGLLPFAVGMFLACVVSVVLFTCVGWCLRSLGYTEVYTRLP